MSDNPKPSRRALLRSTLAALIAAAVATVLFVLPAEYGVDPTGLGAKLGLTRLAAIEEDHDDHDEPTNTVVGTYPGLPSEEDFDYFEPEVFGEPFSKGHTERYRQDRFSIELDVSEQVEYKAVMQRGDAIVYTWSVNSETVYTDFHADPGEGAEGYPEGYFIRYRESETATDSGSIVAPFAGNHGWYWLNIEEQPVTITLEVAGYYERVDELFRSYQ
ncbi:MAG: hypothetical protein AAF417_05710 [Pseudomonadota bacterium]